MIISPNNTLIGIRLDDSPRRPAYPAALPDFGSDAELEVERQAHAVTMRLLEEARAQLADIQRDMNELAGQAAADHIELTRLRTMLGAAAIALRRSTSINLEMLDRMAGGATSESEDDEYVVEVYS